MILHALLAVLPFANPALNIAPQAQARASESYQDFAAALVNDGDAATRWSGIPGHNAGVWIELEWPRTVHIAEVVIRQFQRFVLEADLQVWDARTQDWRTLQHLGRPGRRLAALVLCRFEPVETTRLRIGNITNGPSFTEIEVYETPLAYELETRLASDVDGHIVGIVTDSLGAAPVEAAEVALSGRSRSGEWRATARSDADGLFTLPMPVGLVGNVAVATSAAGRIRTQEFDSATLAYGLTPRSVDEPPIDLSGRWRFCPDPPADFWRNEFDDGAWATIAVPAHWEMQGFHPAGGVGGYRMRFAPPPGSGRLILIFDGVYSGAEVWVNGVRLAYHECGATPFECDITDVLRDAENVLAVRVTEHTVTSDQLDQMSSYADFPLGGILRRVHLLRVPDAHVAALALHSVFDASYCNAALDGRLAVVNASDRPLDDGLVTFELTDPAGRAVPLNVPPMQVQAGPWQRVEAPIHLPVDRPLHWDAEHPNLYRLTISLHTNGSAGQRLVRRVGFRQTDVRGAALLINGAPVKLRGTCHHDSHPLMGRAVTDELTRLDLTLMRQANLNAVRTSHYPPIEALIDIADELGLYVEDEAPFCWVGVSDDLRLTPHILQLTAELLARDRNHPSVFMWSLCNESDFGRGFEASHAWVRTADPSRPTGAATSAWLELATQHNPISVARIAEHESLDQPLLWDESFAPFQGIWGDANELWVDPGLRDYYAEPLIPVFERFMGSRATQGSMIWCWADDIFCVPGRGLEYGRGATVAHFIDEAYAAPGRGLVGDAPWGLVDGWRRPKPEFWIVKKMHSPIRIAEAPVALPREGEPLRVPVENRFDFTNLSELKITWRLGDDAGDVRADVPPHSSGELRIAPTRFPSAGDALELTFADADGRGTIDGFRLPLGASLLKPNSAALAPASQPAPPLRIAEESTLAGRAVRIIGGNIELAFDRRSGLLRRGVVAGQPLLLESPAIHILPTGDPLNPLPRRETWRLKAIDAISAGEDVRLRIAGSYDQLEGGYDLLITPAGAVTLTSQFEYHGPDLWAREIGVRMSFPRTCDLLQWERLGEWAIYPEDHIGRPFGSARAFPQHPPGSLPPQWPWSQDSSPLGSNDFRSTKRHILSASLGYPDGPNLRVQSDGHQHVRAIVQPDRIALHISDWYGGTGSGLGEWEQNYGKGQLIVNNQRLESTVRLRLVAPGGSR